MKKYKFTEEDSIDEGFETNPVLSEEIIIHPKKIQETFTPQTSFMISSYKNKNRYKSTEKYNTKLSNIATSLQQVSRVQRNSHLDLVCQQTDIQNQYESKLILKRKDPKREKKIQFSSIEELMESVIIKNKKIEIAENLGLNMQSQTQSETIKHQIIKNPSCTVAFKQKIPNNTYSYFKNLIKYSKDYSFLQSKYNMILKNKLAKQKAKSDTLITKQEKVVEKKNCFDFQGQFESGNIDFALKVDQNEYNVFLKIDTNTKGHQSWFYFKAINRFNEAKTIKINICNVKRRFKMMQKGQKIYIKSEMNENPDWRLLENELLVSTTARKRYKISFQISFKPNQEIYISLIPPYTYSTLLKDIEQFNKSNDLKVDILTYSISGLAIPILTVTKDACSVHAKIKNLNRKRVFLISGRIHPSQTCSSFIINGIIRQLLNGNERNQEFLKNNIIKIVPMLNPDGVVFGNFRTNYLGDDLNRAFHRTDETIYPEIIALKELGKNLQAQFGQNFVGFIDMHGHSCQTNSFVYGPQYQQNTESYTECRIFPKILDKISKYFKYDMSEFRLPEYKSNTARGYFFKKLKIPSYTIETSYSLFYQKDKCEGFPVEMSISHWKELGQQIATSMFYYYKYLESMKPNPDKISFKKDKQSKKQNQKKHQRQSSTVNDILNFKSLKKEIEKEAALKETQRAYKNKEENSSESDGQSCEEDLTQNQRQHLHKKIKDIITPSYSLPKVIKPSLALPAVAPSIWATGKSQEKIISTIPFITNKIRQKKLVRPFNITHEYTQYLINNIQGAGSLKPQVYKYIRIQNRDSIKQKNVFQQF